MSSPETEPTPLAPRSSEYEFSERDGEIIRSLARKMNFVGLFALGVGVFVIFLGALMGHAGSILSGALYALIGIWTHRASVSFRNVADTRGNDISNLMHALHDLQKLYGFQFWLCALGLLASIITSIALLYHRTL